MENPLLRVNMYRTMLVCEVCLENVESAQKNFLLQKT